MRYFKKSVSVVLAVLMLLSVFTLGANAAETKKAPSGGSFKTIVFKSDKGSTLTLLDWDGYNPDAVPGASYDEETNTLTLNSVNLPDKYLEVYSMGADFRICVLGECYLNYISAYHSCIEITGTGDLEIKTDSPCGIEFKPAYGYYYPSALSVGKTVNLRITCTDSAIKFFSSSTDYNNVLTIAGAEVQELHIDSENFENITKKVRAGNYFTYENAYLMTCSDSEGDFCGLEYYDGDLDTNYFEVYKCKFSESDNTYYLSAPVEADKDDSSEPLKIYPDELESSKYSLVKKDDDKVRIPCKQLEDWGEMDIYENGESSNFVVNWSNDVYTFSEDNKADYNGTELYILTKNEEVSISDLSPVLTGETVYYHDFSYGGNSFEAEGTIERGAKPSIYLDGATEETLLVVKTLSGYKKLNEVQGISYDSESNTLTLDNFKAPDAKLATYYMGSNFKLNVKGVCELGQITVNNGGLSVIGDGFLTVDSAGDYGISLEQSSEAFYDSRLEFSEDTGYSVSGKTAAYSIVNTTVKEDETGLKNIKKTAESKKEVQKTMGGAELSAWSGGFGFRYKIENSNEPGEVFCGQYTKTTKMNAYGNPDTVIETWDMKRVSYNDDFGCYVIVESIGEMDGQKFSDLGFYVVANGSTPVQLTCYEATILTCDVCADSEGKNYAVKNNNVYNFSSEKTYENENGEKIYILESNESLKANDLTPVMNEFTVYSYAYDGTQLTNKSIPATEPGTEAPTTENPTEGSTKAPGDKPTEPGEKPSTPADQPTEPGENPSTPADQPTEPGENPSTPADQPTEPGDKPTEPGEKPTTPADKPTEPGEKPTTPADKPTEPGEKPTEAQPSGSTRVFNYLPSKEQLADGDTIKLVVQDENGAFVTYKLTATPMICDGIPVYTTNLPADVNPVALQVQVYKGDAFKSQVTVTKDQFEAATDKIMTSDGKPYEEQKPTDTTKKKQPMKVSVKAKKIKVKDLKRDAQKISPLKVTAAKGTVSYKLVKKGSTKNIFSFLSISKKGKITIKKWNKAKKGKYTIVVKVTAKGTKKYQKGSKTVKVKLTLK